MAIFYVRDLTNTPPVHDNDHVLGEEVDSGSFNTEQAAVAVFLAAHPNEVYSQLGVVRKEALKVATVEYVPSVISVEPE